MFDNKERMFILWQLPVTASGSLGTIKAQVNAA
jgi:hypothetical protein